MIINDTMFNDSLEDIIYELRRQLAINNVSLLGEVKDTPDNLMVSCPYHKNGQEKKPSMGIKKADGICHCFTCNSTHTLPEFISHCFGHDEDIGGMFGWNWLLKNFLSVSVETRKEIKLEVTRGIFKYRHTDNVVAYVAESTLDSYRYTHPYMYKRKMTDEVIDLFDVGYDKETQCITFPIRDINGNTLFVARRSVNTKYFNYPSGAEKPVYGLYEWSKTNDGFNMRDTVIICESMIDAITCWVYGKRAVALNGLGTDLQFKQLNAMPCRKFILATDMDDAGMKARQRIKKALRNKIVTEYLWDLDVAKDINDMSKDYFDSLKEVF